MKSVWRTVEPAPTVRVVLERILMGGTVSRARGGQRVQPVHVLWSWADGSCSTLSHNEESFNSRI